MSHAFGLPDTGQTTCYNVGGVTAIPCSGTGQDGAHTLNPMSYTDNGNGTVKDNVTGITWEKQDTSENLIWEAAGTYCASLTLAGASWRLPTNKELQGTFDYSTTSEVPSNARYFSYTNGQPSSYWSSTTFSNPKLPTFAWNMFSDGGVYGYYESVLNAARCVQAGVEQPQPSFTNNVDGTVTDSTTGLMWQQDESVLLSWGGALSFCTSLSLGGHSDWRVPNIKELVSITDDTKFSPAIDTTFFRFAHPDSYWSSTSDANYVPDAWSVSFSDGSAYTFDKTVNYYARCVRGGTKVYLAFSDVPSSDSFYGYIEAIYGAGITTGCGNGEYCPAEDVTRDQMAAFLVRGTQVKAGQSPTSFGCTGGRSCATEIPYFSDVSGAEQFFSYIQKLKELGVTTGCGNGDYCPSENVTRDQMAAFIIRALYGSSFACTGGVAGATVNCAATTPYFTDVTTTDQFFPYVQKMKELGITTGCGNGEYCPSENVTRDQMAAFLARAFLGMQ